METNEKNAKANMYGLVCVKGLPHTTGQKEVEELCAQHGPVASVRVVQLQERDTSERLGFAIIRMGSPEGRTQVVSALNGFCLAGKSIRCFGI